MSSARAVLPVFLVLALALASAAPAQAGPTTVTAKLVTLSQLRVTANAPSGSVTNTKPASVDITKPFALEAFPPRLESSAAYIPFLEGSPATGWRLTISDGANATNTASASSGTNTVLLYLVSSRGQRVQFTISLRSSVLGNGAAFSALVDINNDGKAELTGTQTVYTSKQFTGAVGQAGLPIRIATGGTTGSQNQPRSGFRGILTVEVRPISTCTAIPYGRGCLAGARLSARMTWDHEIELVMQRALQNVPALLGIGTQRLNLPLPTVLPSCLLHTDLAAVVLTSTDNRGVAILKIPIPRSLKATANAQMFTVRQPAQGIWDVRSTNGLQVTCK